jgi:L-aspartate oxidase
MGGGDRHERTGRNRTRTTRRGNRGSDKPEDSFELHVRDTLEAGAGLCKEAVVRTIIEEGPARINELIELGMQFSNGRFRARTGRGNWIWAMEGGHSKRRILHAKDVTGREIERALLAAIARQPNN